MSEQPEKIVEKEERKEVGLSQLNKILDEYLAARLAHQSAWEELGRVQIPRVIASISDLNAHSAARGKLLSASNALNKAGDLFRECEAKLIDALPAEDVLFKLRSGGKDYGVEKKFNLSGRFVLSIHE